MRKIVSLLILLFVATGCAAHKHKCDMKPKGEGKCSSCQGCEHKGESCGCGKKSCS